MTPVAAALLKAGDYLPASDQTVVTGPWRDARTPAGKVELIVSTGSGRRRVVWGARTTIGVVRA